MRYVVQPFTWQVDTTIMSAGRFLQKHVKFPWSISLLSWGPKRVFIKANKPIWLSADEVERTGSSKQLQQIADGGSDLSEPEMTESLRLIILDTIELGGTQSTIDDELWSFVSHLEAVLVHAPGSRWIWVATPMLLHFFYYADGKPTNIVMDDEVEQQFNEYYRPLRADRKVRRRSIISMLLSQELMGNIVPYKDCCGRLAWKVSTDANRA